MADTGDMAAAAAAAASSQDSSMYQFNGTAALITHLRMEADLAEEKARRLRHQAANLAESFGISERAQQAYELDPGEMPPLDENGLPKYKGKKRGRKPRPRKRKANPNRRKRQHTGYTLFMQESYPGVKEANPDFASKDIIAILAKQWAEMAPDEKSDWKAKALATHSENDQDDSDMRAAVEAVVDDDEDEEEDDEELEEEEDDDEPAPPARKSRRAKK
eukprot:Nitzschia sp. Nitz4//scaffold79_size90958//26588//27339//NITZ4_005015-RA/size90958-augustus-gene-0.174-mRNA-1//-1//CDS//3329558219//9190//frame0